MLELKETGSILVSGNKDAAAISAGIVAGNIINDRIARLVIPKLPVMARGYAQTELGKAVIANAIAGVIIHTMPESKRAVQASGYMIQSASLKVMESFNIQDIINELLDGIELPTEATGETE